METNSWARLLAHVTGLVNQRLLLQCEYLIAENRIRRSHLPDNVRLSDSERRALANIGKRLGRKLLADVACVAKPETILGRYHPKQIWIYENHRWTFWKALAAAVTAAGVCRYSYSGKSSSGLNTFPQYANPLSGDNFT